MVKDKSWGKVLPDSAGEGSRSVGESTPKTDGKKKVLAT